jgi:phosphoglycolate phosphatase-like HAD superfamily hydrolase
MAVAVLDIDGTLVDTNYHHAIAWYRAFRQSGIVLPLWRIHRHIGMGGDQLVQALTDEATEQEHGDEIRDAEKTLYFEPIDEVEPMEGSRERVSGSADEAVMIGDTPWDVRAASNAGVPTLTVRTGGFGDDELREAGAIAVFESVAELRAQLDQTPLK